MTAGDAGEFKIVFTGPMGAGKTTAIAAISEVRPILTEVDNSDRESHAKASTTVGFDFGRISLPGGNQLRLYGTPGQTRFRFMWNILGRGAAGVIVLLDATRPDALQQLDQFVDAFVPLVPAGAIVVGVGRSAEPGAAASDAFARHLEARGLVVPVLSIDARESRDVRLLLHTLTCILESHAACAEAAA